MIHSILFFLSGAVLTCASKLDGELAYGLGLLGCILLALATGLLIKHYQEQ